jgi:hypothetical protein
MIGDDCRSIDDEIEFGNTKRFLEFRPVPLATVPGIFSRGRAGVRD